MPRREEPLSLTSVRGAAFGGGGGGGWPIEKLLCPQMLDCMRAGTDQWMLSQIVSSGSKLQVLSWPMLDLSMLTAIRS